MTIRRGTFDLIL